MPENTTMPSAYKEDILVVKIREGLYEAIQKSDSVTLEDLGDQTITLQKLIIKAIDNFDLYDQVTIQWYLDGEVIEHDSLRVWELGNKSLLNQVHEFHTTQNPTVDQIRDFYLGMDDPSLADFIKDSTWKYLRQYYKEHDEIPYRDLYLINLDIYEEFKNLEELVGHNGGISEKHYDKLESLYEDFKLEVLYHEEFFSVPAYIDVFFDLILQMFSSITHDDGQSRGFSDEDLAPIIHHIKTFYYEGVWRAIAYIISHETVKGPRGNKVEKRRQGELAGHRPEFRNRYNTLVEELSRAGIEFDHTIRELPDLKIYESGRDTQPPEWLREEDAKNSEGESFVNDCFAMQSIDDMLELGGEEKGPPLSELIVEERKRDR